MTYSQELKTAILGHFLHMQNEEEDNQGLKSLEKLLIQPEILAIWFSRWERLKNKQTRDKKCFLQK